MAYFICNVLFKIAFRNERVKKEIGDMFLKRFETDLEPEMNIVTHGVAAAIIWNLRKSGQWKESQFCLAMNDLVVASDKYLKMELEKR